MTLTRTLKHWPLALGATVLMGGGTATMVARHTDGHASVPTLGAVAPVAATDARTTGRAADETFVVGGGDGGGVYPDPVQAPVDGGDGTVVVVGGDGGWVYPDPVQAPVDSGDGTVVVGGDGGDLYAQPVDTSVDPGGTVPDGTTVVTGDQPGTTVDVPVDPGYTPEGMGLGATTPNVPGYDPHAPTNDPDPIPTDYP